MKKNDLNSLKAMFYPMNVFNERNICGFFPLSHYNQKLNHKLSANHTI